MAAGILKLDTAYRPDYEPQSWHNMENIVAGKITDKTQIPDVAFPLYLEDYPTPPGYIHACKGCAKQIVADHPTHGKVILGTFSSQYEVFSNELIFERIRDAFDANQIPAELVFALTMKNLSMVSYSFAIKDASEFMAGGRPHKMHVCGYSSHDGKMGLNLCGTATNVLCLNTWRMMMKGEKHALDYTFYHDKTGSKLFDELPRLIEATLLHVSAYSKLADQMANKTLSLRKAHAIALELLAKGESEISTRVVNQAEELARLFKSGIGNNGDDLFDLVNAATEFWTRGIGSGKEASADKKLFSSEFGSAADKKQQFILALQNKDGELISDAEIDALANQGEKLLVQYA